MQEIQIELRKVLEQTRQEKNGLPLNNIAKEIVGVFDYAEQDYIIRTILAYR